MWLTKKEANGEKITTTRTITEIAVNKNASGILRKTFILAKEIVNLKSHM